MLFTDTPIFLNETHPLARRYIKWWNKRCNTKSYWKRLYYEFLIAIFCELSLKYGEVISKNEEEVFKKPESVNAHAYFLGTQIGAWVKAEILFFIVKFICWVMCVVWLFKATQCNII